MTERPGDAARFEPTAIGQRRTGGGLAVAGWVVVIVAVIGLALAGKVASAPTVVALATAPPTSVADLVALVPASSDPGLLRSVPLTGEAAGISTVITFKRTRTASLAPADKRQQPWLVIKGGVLAHASSLVVNVEAPAGRVVQSRGFSLPEPDDAGIRPDDSPTVSLALSLPAPFAGSVWVDVSAMNETGQVLADVYREVAVGTGATSSGWRSVSQSAIAK